MDENKGYLDLIIYSILAGIVGVFVKLTQGLDANSIVFFRAAFAVVFIFLIILFQRRIKELTIVDPVKTLFVGIFQGLSIFLYFTALLQTSVSNAVFLLYTAPIFSIILTKLFLKEQIEKETLIGMFITLIGILLILDPRTFSSNSNETIGNLLALGAGFFYSAMTITAKPLMQKAPAHYVTFWQYLIITLIFLFFLKIDSISAVYDNLFYLGIIGVICTGIPFILFMEGIRKIKAQKVLVVTALEPLAGTILALFLLKEIPSLFTIIGAALILYGVYRVTRR
ncbi:EamA family transporter [Candidatus Micrarchaeota archaeon]|nr:EamA family transporter [Candidatus Micrarchaeota archaeon]